jgi:hypothetical protein
VDIPSTQLPEYWNNPDRTRCACVDRDDIASRVACADVCADQRRGVWWGRHARPIDARSPALAPDTRRPIGGARAARGYSMSNAVLGTTTPSPADVRVAADLLDQWWEMLARVDSIGDVRLTVSNRTETTTRFRLRFGVCYVEAEAGGWQEINGLGGSALDATEWDRLQELAIARDVQIRDDGPHPNVAIGLRLDRAGVASLGDEYAPILGALRDARDELYFDVQHRFLRSGYLVASRQDLWVARLGVRRPIIALQLRLAPPRS